MKKFFSVELAIILLSIMVYLVIGMVSIKVKSFGDRDFHLEAIKIVACLRGESSWNEVTLNKAPLPSVFYVAPYALVPTGSSDGTYWTIAMIWSGIFITGALILIYRAAYNVFKSQWTGILSIILSLVIPLHIYYGLGVMAEGPAYIAISLALYGWSIFEVNLKRGITYYSLGIIFLILARPNAMLILPMLFVCSGFLWWRRKGDLQIQKALTLAAVVCGITVLIVFSLIKTLPASKGSSQENYFLHVAQHGRFQFRDETWDWRFWDDNVRGDSKDYQHSHIVKNQLDSVVETGASYEEVYSRWIIDDVLENPGQTLKQFAVRVVYGHTLTINSVTKDSFSLGPMRGPIGYYFFIGGLNTLNWSMILLAFYGLYMLRNRWTELLCMLLPWLALIVFSASVYMEQRYLFPIRPIIILFASGGLFYLLSSLRLRFRPDTQN